MSVLALASVQTCRIISVQPLSKIPEPSDPRVSCEPEEGMMGYPCRDWHIYVFVVDTRRPSVCWWESSGGQIWEARVGQG